MTPFARLRHLLGFERLAYQRNVYQALLPAFFFMMSLALYGLAGDGQPASYENLYRFGWVVLLLAALLNTDRFWGTDGEDGTLTQWHLLPVPMHDVLAAKALNLWLFCQLPPVVVMAGGIWLQTGDHTIWAALPIMLIGTITTTALAVLAATMQLLGGRRQNNGGLILLPFFIPVLIFGANATQAAYWQGLAYQAGLMLILVPLCTGATLWLLDMHRKG